jgi:hypothetical protein
LRKTRATFVLDPAPSPIVFFIPQSPLFGVSATTAHGDQTTRMCSATSSPVVFPMLTILLRIGALVRL